MKLPIIKQVTIADLSLYTQIIEWSVEPGINMVIGGNGTGKTTLVNTILYGLVGNEHYAKLNPRTGKSERIVLVDREYFQGRIQPKDQQLARVILTFQIEKQEISVTRSLYRPAILRIELNEQGDGDTKIIEGKSSELEHIYREMMEELLEIDRFEYFTFLVANLLLFDEERRSDLVGWLPPGFGVEVPVYGEGPLNGETILDDHALLRA